MAISVERPPIPAPFTTPTPAHHTPLPSGYPQQRPPYPREDSRADTVPAQSKPVQPRRAFQRVSGGTNHRESPIPTTAFEPPSPPPQNHQQHQPQPQQLLSISLLLSSGLRRFQHLTNSQKLSLPTPASSVPGQPAIPNVVLPLPSTPSLGALRFGFLCLLWYSASAVSSNTGKSILKRFPYPVSLTFVQFGFVAAYCALFLIVRQRQSGNPRQSGIQRASRTALLNTSVMCFFQVAGHVFTSTAISRVPVSTVHTIKALSPLFTVLSYGALFGVRYTSSIYLSLVPLTLGVMLACSFDLRANATGLLCALGSTAIFVSQNIFSKKLLPKESSPDFPQSYPTSSHGKSNSFSPPAPPGRLDKVNLLLYSSGMAFIFMLPLFFYTDLQQFFRPDHTRPSASWLEVTSLFFINGTVHFVQNLIAFTILARTSPVTYSIASLIKRVAVICLAIVWWGQKIYFTQALGMIMAFGGLFMYNSRKSDVSKGEAKRVQVEDKGSLVLPSNMHDINSLDGITPPPTRKPSPSANSRDQKYSTRLQV